MCLVISFDKHGNDILKMDSQEWISFMFVFTMKSYRSMVASTPTTRLKRVERDSKHTICLYEQRRITFDM